VKDRPPPQYTLPFMLLRFYLMIADINGRNMSYKINNCIVFDVLCSFWQLKQDYLRNKLSVSNRTASVINPDRAHVKNLSLTKHSLSSGGKA